MKTFRCFYLPNRHCRKLRHKDIDGADFIDVLWKVHLYLMTVPLADYQIINIEDLETGQNAWSRSTAITLQDVLRIHDEPAPTEPPRRQARLVFKNASGRLRVRVVTARLPLEPIDEYEIYHLSEVQGRDGYLLSKRCDYMQGTIDEQSIDNPNGRIYEPEPAPDPDGYLPYNEDGNSSMAGYTRGF